MIDIIKLEEDLDKINADYGSKDEYCIFCKSTEVNSVVGIVHSDSCWITLLRKQIKDDEILEEIFSQVWKNKHGDQPYE